MNPLFSVLKCVFRLGGVEDQNKLGLVARNPDFDACELSFKGAAFIICFLEIKQLNLLYAKFYYHQLSRLDLVLTGRIPRSHVRWQPASRYQMDVNRLHLVFGLIQGEATSRLA